MVRFGEFSIYEMVFRIGMLYVNLKESKKGTFEETDAFAALDPSEKGAISYFLGLSTAKLLSHRFLKVPWLMHLDVYKKSLVPLQPSRSINGIKKAKPDLVGRDMNGNWIVIEAKGRSGNKDGKLMAKAKLQTRFLRKINGYYPSIRVAHVSYFKQRHTLFTHWEDPEDYNETAPDLVITDDEFIRAYYAPIRALFASDQVEVTEEIHRGDSYRMLSLPGIDVRIGLLNVSDGELELALARRREHMLSLLVADDSTSENLNQFIGWDGILIEAGPSWGQERMMAQPNQRPPIITPAGGPALAESEPLTQLRKVD